MAICPICHRDHAGDAAEATAQEKKRKEEEGVLAEPAPKAITEVGGNQMNVKRTKTFSFSFNEDPILISHEKALKITSLIMPLEQQAMAYLGTGSERVIHSYLIGGIIHFTAVSKNLRFHQHYFHARREFVPETTVENGFGFVFEDEAQVLKVVAPNETEQTIKTRYHPVQVSYAVDRMIARFAAFEKLLFEDKWSLEENGRPLYHSTSNSFALGSRCWTISTPFRCSIYSHGLFATPQLRLEAFLRAKFEFSAYMRDLLMFGANLPSGKTPA